LDTPGHGNTGALRNTVAPEKSSRNFLLYMSRAVQRLRQRGQNVDRPSL
jgi:hypothetical protein